MNADEINRFLEESFETNELFSADMEAQKEKYFKVFKNVFQYHYENCPEYKRYCDIVGIIPDHIRSYDDLNKIPLIPSDAFRDYPKPILSVPEEEVIFESTTSSTTSKKPARFYMDRKTLARINKLNAKLFKEFFGMKGDGTVLFVTPSPKESDTGLVKGMYLAMKEMGLNNIHFAVKEGHLDLELAKNVIINSKKPFYIYGPPFAVLQLFEQADIPQGSFGAQDLILTTGGWKTFKQHISTEEFRRIISEKTGMKESQIRDMLGLTDLFTVMPECEHHHKHVPSFIYISILDPEDISRTLPDGEEGLIAYKSAVMTSYPAFVITGDLGRVWTQTCECGLSGQVIEITGRAKSLGARGCAIRLEQFMKGISKKG